MTQQLSISFFNTISLNKSDLKIAEDKSTEQEKRVLEIMKSKNPMTPIEVWKIYERRYGMILLTSVRRSMTCLTKGGKLEKLEEMKKELYGKPNFLWKRK